MGGDRIGSVERLRFLSAVSLSQRFIPEAEMSVCFLTGNTSMKALSAFGRRADINSSRRANRVARLCGPKDGYEF